jgi:hypothetical protein
MAPLGTHTEIIIPLLVLAFTPLSKFLMVGFINMKKMGMWKFWDQRLIKEMIAIFGSGAIENDYRSTEKRN